MRKPNECSGCPFVGNHQGYVPPVLTQDSPILLMGECATSDDVRGIVYADTEMEQSGPKPYLGHRGMTLDKVGYNHINRDYRIRCIPPSRYTTEQLHGALKHCNIHLHDDPPPSTQLIVAHGEWAWDFYLDQYHLLHKKKTWQATPEDYLPIHEWRGFLSPFQRVTKLPVYGIQRVHDQKGRDSERWDKVARYLTTKDWAKVSRILNHTWPLKEPTNVIVVTRETDPSAINTFFERYLARATSPLVIDTEYTIKDSYLRLFGCGYHVGSEEYYLQLYWSNSQNPGAPRNTVVEWMFDIRNNKPHLGFLFQNAAADNPVLNKNWSFYGQWGWPTNYHDTMLLHAKVESELPHSLMFMESIYSRRAKKKHLSSTNELLYHLGDLSTTLDCYVGLTEKMTPGMWNVYKTQDLPVFPLVQWSRTNGIRVDHNKVEPLYEKLKGYMAHAIQIAEWYCGKGPLFNLNSDQQCKEWFYGREGHKPIIDRLTHKPTINNDALLRLRQAYAHDENAWEVLEGDEIWNPTILEQRIYDGNCHPLMEAKAAFNYYEDKVAKYIRTQLYTDKGDKCLRIFPNISIHAQATGRHSTTAPPLAQWPDEMQDLLTPDPGFMWIGGDFSGQEVWLYSCLSKDEKTLKALQLGYDTHTISMCDLFNMDYPTDMSDPYYGAINDKWRLQYAITGKKDPRRDWAKAAVFSLRYLKGVDKLHLIPGSRSLGITAELGLEMANRFFERNSAIKAYRESVLTMRPTESVSFCGRVRKLNETGNKLLREYINSPIQGGGADMLNHTIIRACNVDPKCIHYIYGVHDSFWFSLPLDQEAELVPRIKEAITQPYEVYGYTIIPPVEWKERYSSV